MNFNVFAALLVCAIAIVAAQDTNTAGGQAGSVTSDINAPTTAPPATTAPGVAAAPAGVDPATTGAPAPPAVAGQAPGPAWAANPAPMTDSGSGSFGSAGDIETPVTKKPKRVADSSRSQSSTPTPSEDSSAPMLTATTGALTVAGLLGLAAML